MTKEEGNKIIAEFENNAFHNAYYSPATMKYHSSWDWLMPVIEKIATIDKGKFSVDISSVGQWACFIKRDDVFENCIAEFGGFEPMILNVWKSVIKFIDWYNKNK